MRLGVMSAALSLVLALTAPTAGASSCAKLRAHREVAPIEAYDAKPGAPRVFAMQPKQDPRNVVTYAAFRRKIDCMIREVIVPRLARDRPNVVVFNEDIGLMTIATGSRGKAARDLFASGAVAPGCEGAASPCVALPTGRIVASNRKVPLTPIEQALSVTPGASTGPEAIANLRPFRLPGTRARLGFATSLPAFTYGHPPAGTDPCSDTARYYMRCLDRLGANVVIQADANPGPWTGPDGDGIERWQPLSWMTSTWRAVADPGVSFAYDVTPMLTGNLADITFDGQSAITQRGLKGRGCHYIGNARWTGGEDRPDLTGEAGRKPQFLALAPWVVPDGPRSRLRAVGAQLEHGSGSRLENDYVETALVADLPFPPDPNRKGCTVAP